MQIRSFRSTDLSTLVDITIEVFGPFYEESFRAMVPPDVFTHQHGSWKTTTGGRFPNSTAPIKAGTSLWRRAMMVKSWATSHGTSTLTVITVRSTPWPYFLAPEARVSDERCASTP